MKHLELNRIMQARNKAIRQRKLEAMRNAWHKVKYEAMLIAAILLGYSTLYGWRAIL